MNKIKVIALFLIVLGFFLFYLASLFDLDHVSVYNDVVDLRQPNMFARARYPFDFGRAYQYPIEPYLILMQPNDYLTVSFHAFPLNGTVYIVLWNEISDTVLNYSPSFASSAFLDFKAPDKMLVEAYVISNNTDNVIPVTVTLHHYERPHWLFFSAGVSVIVLATVLLSIPHLPRKPHLV